MLTNVRHQETGVRFILRREDAILSRQLSAQVCSATGAELCEQEDGSTALGGMIADVMGLGKTLTTLVSILRSSQKVLEVPVASLAFCPLGGDVVRTKATLVVVPSARKSRGLFRYPIKVGPADISDRAFGELGI